MGPGELWSKRSMWPSLANGHVSGWLLKHFQSRPRVRCHTAVEDSNDAAEHRNDDATRCDDDARHRNDGARHCFVEVVHFVHAVVHLSGETVLTSYDAVR